MRRFVTLSLSLSLLLGLSAAGRLTAQDEKKAEEAPEAAEATTSAPLTETLETAAEKAIPPEVQAKIDAARRAVAEAIVAAQDAGLVDSSIDPPPILDILITGRATDLAALKGASDENPEIGVSPEVFGAWFTGYARSVEGITAEKNVRIIPPSKGLKDWYDRRAAILREEITAVRAALAPTPIAAETPTDTPAVEEPTADEPATEPAVEVPTADEPATEPAVEEPTAEEPATEGTRETP